MLFFGISSEGSAPEVGDEELLVFGASLFVPSFPPINTIKIQMIATASSNTKGTAIVQKGKPLGAVVTTVLLDDLFDDDLLLIVSIP